MVTLHLVISEEITLGYQCRRGDAGDPLDQSSSVNLH
uniref:Uncharacterized protein n=1 Tax=Arundo donax TaxID=35708 RepID=A0A0A8YQB9_ARUDO